MADFLSRYTGQQIDTILESVDGKVSKNDIVNDFAVDDPLFPPSSHLTYELKKAVDDINDTLTNKVIRTDGGEQTINGRKTFAADIRASGGITVPTGKKVTITDEPSEVTDGVNLSMLRKHGVSEDTAGPGLKIELLPNGYNKLTVDGSTLSAYTGSSVPASILVNSGTETMKYDTATFVTAIFNDTRFNAYLKISDYDSDMIDIQNQFSAVNTTLGQKVNTSTYNTKMSSLDASILDLTNNKVNVTTYNTKMSSLDNSISSINGSISTINTTLGQKVDTTTYDTKMSSLDAAILGRVTLAKTNPSSITIPISGNNVLPDFTLVNLCQVLVSAQWGTGNIVDTYRVTITRDGTVKTELLVQKSTAGTVTFAGSVVASKLRLTITNANTTTACSVDYNLVASF